MGINLDCPKQSRHMVTSITVPKPKPSLFEESVFTVPEWTHSCNLGCLSSKKTNPLLELVA